MSTELKREGWTPTKFDEPGGQRQWAAGSWAEHLLVSGDDGSNRFRGSLHLSLFVGTHSTPEETAITIERLRDVIREAIRSSDVLVEVAAC